MLKLNEINKMPYEMNNCKLTPIRKKQRKNLRFFLKKLRLIETETARVESVTLPPSKALNEVLVSRGTSPMTTGAKIADLLRRPQLNYDALTPFDPTRPDLPDEIFEQVEIDVKYFAETDSDLAAA